MKKNRIPEIHFYEWRVLAWRTSTTRARLDHEGRSIFRELLDIAYTQGSIPRQRDEQAAVADCSADSIERIWPVIKKHFSVDPNDPEKLKNPQSDLYRREYFLYLRKQKRNGSKGGKKSMSPNSNESSDIETSGLESSNQWGKPIREEKRRDKKRRDEKTQNEKVSTLVTTQYIDSLPPLAQEWIGLILAAGKGLTEMDVCKAIGGNSETVGFIHMPDGDQRKVVTYTRDICLHREPRFIPKPVNILSRREWAIVNPPRVLPSPKQAEAIDKYEETLALAKKASSF